MHVAGRHLADQLRGHRLCLGDLLGLQALALEHVHEVHVPADVQLVSAVHGDAAVLEELRQHPVGDGGTDLALDVIAHDRDTGVLELLGPLGRSGDEDRQSVDEGHARVDRALCVELRGLLRTDGEVAHQDIRAGLAQRLDDVHGAFVGLRDHLSVVLAQAVVGVSTLHRDPGGGHVADGDRVVLAGRDGVREVLSHLLRVDVERRDPLDVGHVVRPELHMHQPRNLALRIGVLVVLDALHKRGGAVTDTDDGDTNRHSFSLLLAGSLPVDLG